ncbi:MAG TPA: hypothetical protein VFE08_08085, partial [Candidatus Sulfotelmatobacter sp.]|nr:hypothetical protein [Candidatus Sulfotelmatobacter sp.]
ASDWSRDGKYLSYSRQLPDAATRQIFALPLEGERKPLLAVQRGASGSLSPNGHWLAYQSNESGRAEVYVVAFGGGQGKWQVSANGGTRPRWSRDGKELYFMDSAFSIFSVAVSDTGGALQFGAPQMLVSNWSSPQAFYDIAPDGKRILLDRVSQDVSQSVNVVTNFTAGLKK